MACRPISGGLLVQAVDRVDADGDDPTAWTTLNAGEPVLEWIAPQPLELLSELDFTHGDEGTEEPRIAVVQDAAVLEEEPRPAVAGLDVRIGAPDPLPGHAQVRVQPAPTVEEERQVLAAAGGLPEPPLEH